MMETSDAALADDAVAWTADPDMNSCSPTSTTARIRGPQYRGF